MASIMVMSGSAAGAEHKIGESVVIGRGPKAGGIFLDDRRASRQHAEILRRGDSFIIRDLGSMNGTFLDGRKIEEAPLEDGAKIRIGNSNLIFLDEKRLARIPAKPTANLTMIEDAGGDGPSPEDGSRFEINATLVRQPAAADQLGDLATAQRLYKQLNILFDATQALSSTRVQTDVLDEVMRRLLDVFPAADRSFIMLLDEETGELVPSAARTRDGKAAQDVVLSRTIVSRVMDEKRAILSRDTSEQAEYSTAESIMELSIQSFMCAPLLYRDKALGILQVDSGRVLPPFAEEDLTLLSSLAAQAALAIQNARDDQERQLLYLGNIGSLVRAVEARDEYTRGHSIRVAEIGKLVAKRMNAHLPHAQQMDLDRILYAGQLHDAGKIAVTEEVLHKPAKLTDEEYEQMKRHPIVTHFILNEMHLPAEIKGMDVIAALHHERYDGKGYPCGFKGEEIPMESRILAAGDTFDAMTSERPYRKAMPADEAMAEIDRVAGTQLDPDVARVFGELYREGGLASVVGEHRLGDLASLPNAEGFRQLIAKLLDSLAPRG